MKVSIESTPRIVNGIATDKNAVPLRVWEGVTDKGTRVTLLVYGIAPDSDNFDEREFDDLIPMNPRPT